MMLLVAGLVAVACFLLGASLTISSPEQVSAEEELTSFLPKLSELELVTTGSDGDMVYYKDSAGRRLHFHRGSSGSGTLTYRGWKIVYSCHMITEFSHSSRNWKTNSFGPGMGTEILWELAY